MDTPLPPADEDAKLPPPPSAAKEPTWWRQGWFPYVSLLSATAAADFLCPRVNGFGVAAAIGVLLGMAAFLLLRRDFSRGECLFLVLLSIVCSAGLLLSGSSFCWIVAMAAPFAMVFAPSSKTYAGHDKYLNWWQFWFSHRVRAEVSNRASRARAIFPLLLSILAGVICFIFFLCIFASGNPVVEMVWNALADAWNRLVLFLNLDWEFCLHAFCWAAGALWFGIYTFKRPEATWPATPSPVANTHSMLPHLAPCVLVGTNLAFLIACATDVAFLWQHCVPAGVSQTEYLYDGAASITCASAIAAMLLVWIFRRSASSRRSRVSRVAGYVLLVQTFVLAVSVYMRLYYQVEAYGFTSRRVLAAESMLMGIAGLVFLALYMNWRKHLWRLLYPTLGVVLLLLLSFSIYTPYRIAGNLNLRYVAAHPHWKFSADDVRYHVFPVQDNLAFAWFVYQQCPDADLRKIIEARCKVLVRQAERRTWRSFSLSSACDEKLAAEILQKLSASSYNNASFTTSSRSADDK